MNYFLIVLSLVTLISCKTANKKDIKKATSNTTKSIQNDTITVSNPHIQYDIVIIEQGFTNWLQSTAKPKGFYSQEYLETKNYQYTVAWNNRVNQPQHFDSNLYETYIDYFQDINYGYNVNYQLYNYFVYFQNKYQQPLLGGRIPTN